VSDRHLSQAIGMYVAYGSLQLETSLCDHAFTVSGSAVARGAEDIKFLLSALQELHVDFGWNRVDPFAVIDSGEEHSVLTKISARHSSLEKWP
jgi:hypothetical protein